MGFDARMDKRKAKRIVMDCAAVIRPHDSNAWLGVMCVDLSSTGMLVQCERNLLPGSRLTVRLEPGLKISPGFIAEVEVVRSEYDPAAYNYRVGTSIVKIFA